MLSKLFFQITPESISLLTHKDFIDLGIGLADARLLVEKFVNKDKTLAACVNQVRKKTDNKYMLLIVEFGWQHWDINKKCYTTVSISNGGGTRRRKFARDTSLKDVIEAMKSVYFPNGKSLSKGRLSLLLSTFCSQDKVKIEDTDITVSQYIQSKYLKNCKFFLRTKPWTPGAFDDQMESSGDSDFEPKSCCSI